MRLLEAARRLWRFTARAIMAALTNCGRAPMMESSFTKLNLLIFEELISWNIPQHACRGAHHDFPCRNVFCDDRSGRHQRILMNRYPRQHRNVGSDTRSAPHGDALVILKPILCTTQKIVIRKSHFRGYETTIPDL